MPKIFLPPKLGLLPRKISGHRLFSRSLYHPLQRNALPSSFNPAFHLPRLPTIRRSYPSRAASSFPTTPFYHRHLPRRCTRRNQERIRPPEKGSTLRARALEALCMAMQAPVVAAVAVVAVLLLSNPLSALAATGGRMGGRAFKPHSSTSSSSSSSSSSSQPSYSSSSTPSSSRPSYSSSSSSNYSSRPSYSSHSSSDSRSSYRSSSYSSYPSSSSSDYS